MNLYFWNRILTLLWCHWNQNHLQRLTWVIHFLGPVSTSLACDGSTSSLQAAVGHLITRVVRSVVAGSVAERLTSWFWTNACKKPNFIFPDCGLIKEYLVTCTLRNKLDTYQTEGNSSLYHLYLTHLGHHTEENSSLLHLYLTQLGHHTEGNSSLCHLYLTHLGHLTEGNSSLLHLYLTHLGHHTEGNSSLYHQYLTNVGHHTEGNSSFHHIYLTYLGHHTWWNSSLYHLGIW